MYEKYLIKFIKMYLNDIMPKLKNRTLNIKDVKKIEKKLNYYWGCLNRDHNDSGDSEISINFYSNLQKCKKDAFSIFEKNLNEEDKEFFVTILK